MAGFLIIFFLVLIMGPDLSSAGQEKSERMAFLALGLPFLSIFWGGIRLFFDQ
jgi:hypothetical protein